MKCRLSETTFPRVSASAIWLASALRLSTSVPKSVRSSIIDAFLKCGIAQTAVQLTHHVIQHVPVRQWVLSLPIPLRLLLAAQPKLVTPVLQAVHRVITGQLLGQSGLKPDEADSGAVTLIQRVVSAANLNIHLHCLVLDGVYRRSAQAEPVFVEAPTTTKKRCRRCCTRSSPD